MDNSGSSANYLFTYFGSRSPNAHAGRVAQLIQETERRGKPEMVERARVRAETTPVAKVGSV
jgi:hypothetical protein